MPDTEPARYRKKPVVIDAIRYQPGPGGNCAAVAAFVGERPPVACAMGDCAGLTWLIHTLEGTMEASPGDWIVKGVQGELYPVKDPIFKATYEPAGGDDDPRDLSEHLQ